MNCDKTEETSLQIFIPCERLFSLLIVFWEEEEWLVGATPSTWNFGSASPHWSKFADFDLIFARSTAAITPSEKSSINTNRKSYMLSKHATCFSVRSYVAPKSPKGGLKTQMASFGKWPWADRRFLHSLGPVAPSKLKLEINWTGSTTWTNNLFIRWTQVHTNFDWHVYAVSRSRTT